MKALYYGIFLGKLEVPASGYGWYFHRVVSKHNNAFSQQESQLFCTQTSYCLRELSFICSFMYSYDLVTNTPRCKWAIYTMVYTSLEHEGWAQFLGSEPVKLFRTSTGLSGY